MIDLAHRGTTCSSSETSWPGNLLGRPHVDEPSGGRSHRVAASPEDPHHSDACRGQGNQADDYDSAAGRAEPTHNSSAARCVRYNGDRGESAARSIVQRDIHKETARSKEGARVEVYTCSGGRVERTDTARERPRVLCPRRAVSTAADEMCDELNGLARIQAGRGWVYVHR